MFQKTLPTLIQPIHLKEAIEQSVQLFIKRDDLIHPTMSGNKWRKLKYNLIAATDFGAHKIVTFGGAYSNHIAAVGELASFSNLEIHAFIRGDELTKDSNETLKKASNQGVQLHFINRNDYANWKRLKDSEGLPREFKGVYLIPEGGANEEGVKGCEEIYGELESSFDHIVLSAGTGTTAAGILRSIENEELWVFSSLKGGDFLKDDILSLQNNPSKKAHQLHLIDEYHFGGFAKTTKELIEFTKGIKDQYQLSLDYLYTAKAFFGLVELIQAGRFEKGSRVLFYHSGGLQGNQYIDILY